VAARFLLDRPKIMKLSICAKMESLPWRGGRLEFGVRSGVASAPGEAMLQSTSQQLYAYWDRVRNGRAAPRRFDIEPDKIAALLPETFIAERTGPRGYRFRLAGTRICEQFGRELRGTDLLDLWADTDRGAISSLLRAVLADATVGYGRSRAYGRTDRHACFEFLFLPLIHIGETPNRLLGTFTAVEPPFWLGTEPLLRQELTELNLHSPGEAPLSVTQTGAEVISLVGRRKKSSKNAQEDSSPPDSQTFN
jgi:hypothetical protein